MKAGLEEAAVETAFPKINEFPFDSDRKRMTVIRRMPADSARGFRAFVKGAPDVLLERCTHILGEDGVVRLIGPDRQLVTSRIADMAKGALRVVAAAYRDLDQSEIRECEEVEGGLVFVGLCEMLDPPREEVRDAVARSAAPVSAWS
jgi:Ca2+-transporting ATPase